MNGLAICAGIGGLELGLSLALGPRYTGVCYVEREAYPASLLVQRMEDGILDHAPIWDDLTTFDGRRWRGQVDIISAGIPCQPFSAAGKRKGLEDERWIWDDVARIIREVGPRHVFLENVPGIVRRGLPSILGTLASLGYNAEWDLYRASDVGAPHKRERWFLLAYASGGKSWESETRNRREGSERGGTQSHKKLADSERELARFDKPGRRNGQGRADQAEPGQSREKLADADGNREVRSQSGDRGGGGSIVPSHEKLAAQPFPPGPDAGPEAYPPGLEPSVCRMADGIPNRVGMLRALGNGVVPAMAALAWNVLHDRIHNC